MDNRPGLIISLETPGINGNYLSSRDLGVKSGQSLKMLPGQRLELGVNALENVLELPSCPQSWAGVPADDFAAGVGWPLNKMG